ncbi:hypothetical protein GCM10029992_15240 [Glycomyces albus]
MTLRFRGEGRTDYPVTRIRVASVTSDSMIYLPVGKVSNVKPSSRTQILEGALDLLREGEAVSLESAARRANLTKPGVMYHFPTKEALMLALLDWVVDCWERDLNAQLEVPSTRPRRSSGRTRTWTGRSPGRSTGPTSSCSPIRNCANR